MPHTKEVEAMDIMEFWETKGKEFPRLQKVAMSLLAVPASSSSSEQGFSESGWVINCRRTSLCAQNVNSLMRISSAISYDPDFFGPLNIL
jgi:hypothetical protein